MKKILLVIAIAFLAVGCGAKQQTQIPATVSDSETKDWKVYTDNTYGFKFRYPQEYRLSGQFVDEKGNFTTIPSMTSPNAQIDFLNKDVTDQDPFISLSLNSFKPLPKNLAEVCQKAGRPVSDANICWDGPAGITQEDLVRSREALEGYTADKKLYVMDYPDNLVQKVVDNDEARVVIFGEVSKQSGTPYFHLRAFNSKGDLISLDVIDSDLARKDIFQLTSGDFEDSPVWIMFQVMAKSFELIK